MPVERKYIDLNTTINNAKRSQVFGDRTDQRLDLYQYITQVVDEAVIPTLSERIEIGDWDMDATVDIDVPHGINTSAYRILSVRGSIRNDADDASYVFGTIAGTANVQLSIDQIDDTNINLIRRTSGVFDDAAFNSTSYNRGWLIVEYEPIS